MNKSNHSSERTPLISVRNLKKSYLSAGESVEILHGLDFDIYPNEFVVILGASGTGKTTLLNILGGLDSADSGQVLVDGTDISHLNEKQLNEYRRVQVGFIFQFYSLMPSLTVAENLRYVAEISHHPLDIEDTLSKVGMWDKRNSFPSQLSSGQQQRAAIARALVKNPSIILADEPTGALDLATSKEVLIAMEEITSQGNGTILLITHNPEIARIADRVIVMRQGNIESDTLNPHRQSAQDLRW